jgi:hypothetical protein
MKRKIGKTLTNFKGWYYLASSEVILLVSKLSYAGDGKSSDYVTSPLDKELEGAKKTIETATNVTKAGLGLADVILAVLLVIGGGVGGYMWYVKTKGHPQQGANTVWATLYALFGVIGGALVWLLIHNFLVSHNLTTTTTTK